MMGATFAPGVGRTEPRGRPSARSGLGGEAPARRFAAIRWGDPWARGSGRFGRSTKRLEKPRDEAMAKPLPLSRVRSADGREAAGPRGTQCRCKERSD